MEGGCRMTSEEIIEMAQILQEMGTDTYMECKYTLLAVSAKRPNLAAFIRELFNVADRRRPLLICMGG